MSNNVQSKLVQVLKVINEIQEKELQLLERLVTYYNTTNIIEQK